MDNVNKGLHEGWESSGILVLLVRTGRESTSETLGVNLRLRGKLVLS